MHLRHDEESAAPRYEEYRAVNRGAWFLYARIAQLVRVLPSHGRGPGFEPQSEYHEEQPRNRAVERFRGFFASCLALTQVTTI